MRYPWGISETGLRFRDSFPYSLSDIDFITLKVARNELVLPEDPLNDAVYALLFAFDSKNLKDSALLRITDFPQSFMGLMGHPCVNRMMKDLREVYDSREHAREEINVEIPRRGGKRWWATEKPTYEGTQYVDMHLIHPVPGFCLAQEFEDVLRKYGAIAMLEEAGRKDVLENMASTAANIDNFV